MGVIMDDLPSFSALREFLENRARSLEMVPLLTFTAKITTTTKNVFHTAFAQLEVHNATSTATKGPICAY